MSEGGQCVLRALLVQGCHVFRRAADSEQATRGFESCTWHCAGVARVDELLELLQELQMPIRKIKLFVPITHNAT